MKQLLIPLLFLIVYSGFSQSPMQSVLKSYFRTHPFDMKFSSFVQTLQKDPWLTIDTYNRRTDTTFFFMSGIYKNFNPFRYTPAEVRIVIAEDEFFHNDSLHTRDTIINMQLMGITDTGIANKKLTEKEFKRFHNNQADRFSNNIHNNIEQNGEMAAEIENYFIYPFSIAPVTIAWGPIPETKQYTFTITIRFKVKLNMADIIISPADMKY